MLRCNCRAKVSCNGANTHLGGLSFKSGKLKRRCRRAREKARVQHVENDATNVASNSSEQPLLLHFQVPPEVSPKGRRGSSGRASGQGAPLSDPTIDAEQVQGDARCSTRCYRRRMQ